MPIYTHAAEMHVAQMSGYTVPEWACIPNDLVRSVTGDERVADGVRIIETPGHTPGHLSVVVDALDDPVVIAGQCVDKTEEVVEHKVAADNMRDDTHLEAGQQSLERLLFLNPRRVVVAHDARSWLPAERTP